jgi:hypothetical protein
VTGSWTQLRALIALRWTMVRSRRVRAGLLALAALVAVLVGLSVLGGRLLPEQRAFNASVLTPSAFLVYAVLAVIGPMSAGGGNELFPPDQLVPHPIRPGAVFLASLALAPLNLAWIGQTAALLTLTAYVVPTTGGLPAALAITLVYAAAATTVGQVVAWLTAGARQSVTGRRVVWALVAAVAVGAYAVVQAGVTHVLDRYAPTRDVVLALLSGARGSYTRWTTMLLALGAVLAVALWSGGRSTAYALRRPPGLTAERVARTVTRRPAAATVLRQLRHIDRAAVWRATALRRGVLVMGGLPGLVTAVAGVDWPTLALTAGLVTAGAGLLFGVNVFCLDGPGALWLGSLPLRPRTHLWAKTLAIAEICVICGLITLVAGAARANEPATLVRVAAALCSVLACTAAVTATCLRMSVTSPFRADLHDPRDTPAPPGAMAVRSARLAVLTTLLALSVSASARAGYLLPPVLILLAVLAVAGRSALRTGRMYADPTVHAHVLVTVSSG